MKGLMAVVFIVLIFGMAYASAGDCKDTDNGIDYNVRGTTTKGSQVEVDTCIIGKSTLLEFYCTDKGVLQFQRHECSSGCKKGVCLGNEQTVSNSSINDSYDNVNSLYADENSSIPTIYVGSNSDSDSGSVVSGNTVSDSSKSSENIFQRIVDWIKGIFSKKP